MGGIRPTRVLADLAQGDLASLLAFLSGQGTSGTSLAAEFSLPRLGRIVPTGPKKRIYKKTPSHDTGHGTGSHWH